jgi:hypothetical protein
MLAQRGSKLEPDTTWLARSSHSSICGGQVRNIINIAYEQRPSRCSYGCKKAAVCTLHAVKASLPYSSLPGPANRVRYLRIIGSPTSSSLHRGRHYERLNRMKETTSAL